jgi:hypothetical protein
LEGLESVITSLAGFEGPRRPHPPGGRTPIPAALRRLLAVSRRTPVACSIRRKVHPSRPSASTCCLFSSLKTLLIPTEATKPLVGVNVPDDYFCMAGFEVIMYGRFWVTPEDKLLLAGTHCL